MKKILYGVLSILLIFSSAACIKKPDGGKVDDKEATKVVIYVDESNLYGSYIKGSDEDYVQEIIQEKFYKDTGNKIDFDIQYQTHDTFYSVFSPVLATSAWDAAIGYLGQVGIDERIMTQGICMDLTDIIDLYGENLTKAVDKKAFYATTMLDGKVLGIPSVNKTNVKGLLIRKDFMEQVGYTEEIGHHDDLGAVNVAPGNKKKTLVTIDDFTDMMRRMKAQISGISYPLFGNMYDIEFAITAGACGTPGYQYRSINYNADGSIKEVVPGWISEDYQTVLNYEYLWQKEGLWEKDNMIRPTSTRQTDFINGKAAIYCVDPNISNLISVSRLVKNVNPAAEFTVIKPLDGEKNGKVLEGAYAAVSRTTDCMIFNKKSKNAEIIVKYLNWLYSNVENYELAKYGVKNEHWVDVKDGFYTYPSGKADKYFVSPPYSGVFSLLHNDEFAYRLYDNYTEEELGWIHTVENARTISNPTDAMLFINMTSSVAFAFQSAENDMFLYCATLAWNASRDPAESYPVAKTKYRSQGESYITWLTQQYKLYKAQRV